MTGREVPSMTGRVVLLFDADSELGRTCVRWAARRDRRGRLRPVSIQTPEGQGLLASVPSSDRGHSLHLLLDGQVYSGRDVLDPLLDLLDRPFAGRFLKRAIAGMGRASQSGSGTGAGAAPALSAMPPTPEAPVLGNGAPVQEAPGSPEATPVADVPPAVGLMDRPTTVPASTTEPPSVADPAASTPPLEAPPAPVEGAPSPEQAEVEPPDLQSRIERSPFGRGVLSMLILITLIAIVAINLPSSDLRRLVMKPGQPYLNVLGLDQAWGVFAPDPRRSSIDVSAVVTYDDGTFAQWHLPRHGALFGSYTDYRWGKWEEFLTQPGLGSSLWLPAAEWAASQEARPGHTIKRVVLVERYRQLLPPGVTPSQGPTQRVVFYSLGLPGAAQRSGQPQAPLPPGGGGL